MATAKQAIEWIAQFINRPGDNGGGYMWTLAGMPEYAGSAWCGVTQVACSKALGLPLDPTTAIRCIYVPYVVQDAKRDGLWRASVHSKPGDWVIFDWMLSGRRDGLADHIGMVVSNDPDSDYIVTIEGNAGRAANGERCVAYHTRWRGDILGTVNRQGVYDGKSTPVVINHAGQNLNEFMSVADRKTMQGILGVDKDGIIGPLTINALIVKAGYDKEAVPALDAKGSNTVKKIQARIIQTCNIDIAIDGIFGKETAAALHTYFAKGGKFTNLAKQSLDVKAKRAPKPEPKPKPPKFPLPKGHAYAENDGTNYTHSGVRGAPDTTNIRRIQSRLGVDSDGIYGPKTKAVVVKFQKAHKLKADGECGPSTGRALELWS